MKHQADYFYESFPRFERDADDELICTKQVEESSSVFADLAASSSSRPDILRTAAAEPHMILYKPNNVVTNHDETLEPLPVDYSQSDFLLPEDDDDFGQGKVHFEESTAVVIEDSSSNTDDQDADYSDPLDFMQDDTFDLLAYLDTLYPIRESEFLPQQGFFQASPPPAVSMQVASSRPAKAEPSIQKIQNKTTRRNPTAAPPATTQKKTTTRKAKRTVTKKKRRNRVRKVHDPDQEHRSYVDFNAKADVALGRGGCTNKNPGNLLYHQDKVALQEEYHQACKNDRTKIAQRLVDMVEARGGHFVKQDDVGWWIVSNHTARTKAGQALRERYTQEERAEKRLRYRLKTQATKKKKTKVQQVA